MKIYLWTDSQSPCMLFKFHKHRLLNNIFNIRQPVQGRRLKTQLIEYISIENTQPKIGTLL
jgi:hypothetical protein